jgi:hypothetical protein
VGSIVKKYKAAERVKIIQPVILLIREKPFMNAVKLNSAKIRKISSATMKSGQFVFAETP